MRKVYWIWIACWLLVGWAEANTLHPVNVFNQTAPIPSLSDRIALISQQWLALPYVDNNLGEGLQGDFDQKPLYRFDNADCQTFVEMVLALSLAKEDFGAFQTYLKRIRYRHGKIAFLQRNHFISGDWIENNVLQRYIKSINEDIAPGETSVVNATLDKRSWYQHLTQDKIYLPAMTGKQQAMALTKLNHLADAIAPVTVSLTYIKLERLLSKQQQLANYPLLSRIPNGTILFVVRPNWLPSTQFGTRINVSHLGFVIQHDGQLWLRHASSLQRKVIDSPLLAYLQFYYHEPKSYVDGISLYEGRSP